MVALGDVDVELGVVAEVWDPGGVLCFCKFASWAFVASAGIGTVGMNALVTDVVYQVVAIPQGQWSPSHPRWASS